MYGSLDGLLNFVGNHDVPRLASKVRWERLSFPNMLASGRRQLTMRAAAHALNLIVLAQ